MKLAIVGWCADSGVGREFTDALTHLPVSCAFVLHNSDKPTRMDLLENTPHHISNELNLAEQMEKFLDEHEPDTVLTWELPGSWSFPTIWERRGIRWVNSVHWDWFSCRPEQEPLWTIAQLLSPNEMCCRLLRERYGLFSWYLPQPIDTDRFAFRERTKAEVFTSIYGFGGPQDRRSVPEILAAWEMIEDPPALIFQAQAEPKGLKLPPNVSVKAGNVSPAERLYATGDIALQPSRYEGIGVPLLEAQSCGMPAITTDAEPMKVLAPDLTITVHHTETRDHAGHAVEVYIPDPQSIAERVRGLKGKDIKELSHAGRKRVEDGYSWKVLRGRWIDALEGRQP